MNCVCTATQGELAPQVFSFTQTQSIKMSVFRACMRFRWRRNCVCCPSASSSSSSSENSLSLRDRETTGSDCCFFFGWHRQRVPEQKALLAAVSRRELAGKKMQPHLRCQVSVGQSRRCWISRATPAIYRCTYSSRDFKLFKRSFKKSKRKKINKNSSSKRLWVNVSAHLNDNKGWQWVIGGLESAAAYNHNIGNCPHKCVYRGF